MRPLVPHDLPPDRLKEHMKRCGDAPPGMILSSMAYNKRCRKTTFGVSNRIGFLRELKDSGRSPAPPYPPQYQGQEFALGISIAGSAGNDNILGPVSNFGRLDGNALPKKSIIETSGNKALDQGQYNSSKRHDEVPPTAIGFKHVIMSEKGSYFVDKSINHRKPQESNDPKRSFKDKYQDTKASILPMADSHFNCSEEYRYGRTFVDEEGLKAKEMYRLKIKNVKDKNASNSKNLFF
jgi:hypothetical protein